MKLINKLIAKTAIYKHLKDLYEQALKDNDAYFDRINKLIDDKNKIAEKYHNLKKDIDIYQQEYIGHKNKIKLDKKAFNYILKVARRLNRKDEDVKLIKKTCTNAIENIKNKNYNYNEGEVIS